MWNWHQDGCERSRYLYDPLGDFRQRGSGSFWRATGLLERHSLGGAWCPNKSDDAGKAAEVIRDFIPLSAAGRVVSQLEGMVRVENLDLPRFPFARLGPVLGLFRELRCCLAA